MNINYLLWVVQVLLAVTLFFAGGMKILLPVGALTFPIPLPWALIRFLGAAEVLGAIGLVLPWLLGIRPVLTPIAAAGLMLIVTGATVITLVGEGVARALFPLILMLLCALVTYGRWQRRRTVERNATPICI